MKASTRAMLRKHDWQIDRTAHNGLCFTQYRPHGRLSPAMTRPAAAAPTRFPSTAYLLLASLARSTAKVLSTADAARIPGRPGGCRFFGSRKPADPPSGPGKGFSPERGSGPGEDAQGRSGGRLRRKPLAGVEGGCAGPASGGGAGREIGRGIES